MSVRHVKNLCQFGKELDEKLWQNLRRYVVNLELAFFKFCFILFYGVDECIFSFHVISLIPTLQDLQNAKSAFERCRFNLVCISTFFHLQVFVQPCQWFSFAVRNSGTCPCEHWSKKEVWVLGINKCSDGCPFEIF